MSMNDTAIELYEKGDLKGALKLACKFRMSFSKEDLEKIQRGYECINHPTLYESIGYDYDKVISEARLTFERFVEHIKSRKSLDSE